MTVLAPSKLPLSLAALAASVLAALALVAPTAAVAAPERTVATSGEATLRVANDSAAIGLSVSRERRGRAAALRAASAGLRRVIAAADRIAGVEPGDVVTGRVAVRRVHRDDRVLYRAVEGVAVTLHQPKRAGELIGAAVAAGASGVSGPRFFVGDTEVVFRKALARAFDAAEARAAALAAQAGGTLGAAVTVDEGSGPELIPFTLADGKGVSAGEGASAPTRPGRSTVTATVHVVFELL